MAVLFQCYSEFSPTPAFATCAWRCDFCRFSSAQCATGSSCMWEEQEIFWSCEGQLAASYTNTPRRHSAAALQSVLRIMLLANRLVSTLATPGPARPGPARPDLPGYCTSESNDAAMLRIMKVFWYLSWSKLATKNKIFVPDFSVLDYFLMPPFCFHSLHLLINICFLLLALEKHAC